MDILCPFNVVWRRCGRDLPAGARNISSCVGIHHMYKVHSFIDLSSGYSGAKQSS